MDKMGELIKEYLKNNLHSGKDSKATDCFDEEVLREYLEGTLNQESRQAAEQHIAGCGFCLSQLNLAQQAQRMHKQGNFKPVPQELINKTKSLLGIDKVKDKKIAKTMGKRFFLISAIFFFILSFVVPKYFIQFLVATLILGIRWAFESKSGRTLIMVLDSWRRHSHDKDDEISHHLKNRF